MIQYSIFFLLFFTCLNSTIAKSVNSGCFSGNKKIDFFCENIGCYTNNLNGKYNQPVIITYIEQNKEKLINFVCSSETQTTNDNIINYNVVTSNEDNEYIVPVSISHSKQFWFSPPFKPSNLGTLNITFNNLEALNPTDYIVIVREDYSVYCEIHNNYLVNNQVYNIIAEPNISMYMIRIALYINNNQQYPNCPTPENPLCENCYNVKLQNYTTSNSQFNLRRSTHHILVYDNAVRVVTGGLE